MTAGSLRHSVIINQPSTTSKGDRGQDVVTWTALATVPAMIEELSGRKLELARQLVATADHQITIRFLAGVDKTCQVMFGIRTFNVGHVGNKMMNNFTMVLTCTEAA